MAKRKESYMMSTEGNDRSGGWKQPKKVKVPQPQYKSNMMKNLRFFIWALLLQLAVVSILALIFEMRAQFISALVFASFVISALLIILRK